VAGFARLFTLVPQLRERLLDCQTPQAAYEVLTGPEAMSVNTVVARRVSGQSPESERAEAC
jgi:hypothetical protein